MAGLHLLQHAKGLSDDAVCAQWLENPYFQVFCGETYFQHKLPLDRSSMTRWRGRIGQDKLEELLAETLAAAQRAKAVDAGKFERITIDTTAQTKAVAHPTDTVVCCCLARARDLLNVAAPSEDDNSVEPTDFRPPCRCCGGSMIIIETFERWRQPRGPPDTTATNRENST